MLMLCGLSGSLPTLTAMLALSGDPPPVGINVTAIVQLEFAATIEPQVPPFRAKSLALEPVMLALTDNEDPDRLVTVTSLVFDEVRAVSVPNASVAAGVTVAGIVEPVVNPTVYESSGSGESVTVIDVASVPSAVGA